MMKKTHLVIGLVVALYFLPYVSKPWIFIPIVLISSLLPDVDSGVTRLGQSGLFKPLQMMTKHRGIMHTYTMAVFLSIIIAYFFPVLALPFFLGYSFHIFADSFTPQGVKPFWPFKAVTNGVVRTGGKVEATILVVFSLIATILIIVRFI